MKKTYYVYYVVYIGKTENDSVTGGCVHSRIKPIAAACDIIDIAETIKNDKNLVEPPTIISLTPLGKKRM